MFARGPTTTGSSDRCRATPRHVERAGPGRGLDLGASVHTRFREFCLCAFAPSRFKSDPMERSASGTALARGIERSAGGSNPVRATAARAARRSRVGSQAAPGGSIGRSLPLRSMSLRSMLRSMSLRSMSPELGARDIDQQLLEWSRPRGMSVHARFQELCLCAVAPLRFKSDPTERRAIGETRHVGSKGLRFEPTERAIGQASQRGGEPLLCGSALRRVRPERSRRQPSCL